MSTAHDRPKRVAILAALAGELAPLRSPMSLRGAWLGDIHGLAGRFRDREVVAATTGIGTSQAAAVTDRLLGSIVIDHVYVIGICGAIPPPTSPSKTEPSASSSSRTEPSATSPSTTGPPLLGIGDLIVPEIVVDAGTGSELRPTTPAGHRPAGRLLTSDELHHTPAQIAPLREQGVSALDMETAAIGAGAEERSVPWSVLRAASDLAGVGPVDAELLATRHADGSMDRRATARYLVAHPGSIGGLVRLGRDAGRAMSVAADAVMSALNL